MDYSMARAQLLGICYRLLESKESELDRRFIELIGASIDEEGRESIISKLLNELILLYEGKVTHYHLITEQSRDKSEILKIVERIDWQVLLQSRNIEKVALGNRINDTFLDGKKLKRNKKVNIDSFNMSTDDFSSFVEKFLFLSMYNSYGLKHLLRDEVKKARLMIDETNYSYPILFERLADTFDLTKLQKDILFYYFLFESIEELGDYVRYSKFDFRERNKAPSVLSKVLKVSSRDIAREISFNSRLVQCMLLKVDDKEIILSQHICSFLYNDDHNLDIFSFFFEKCRVDEAIDINEHRVEKEDVNAFKYLIKGELGSNFLLYGKSGTGKTEFTKSLGRELEIDIYRVKTHNEDSSDLIREKRSAMMAAKSILPRDAILVIDEAEEILDSGSTVFYKDRGDNKAWLNTFMEDHKINIIWVTNDMTMHSSTKRRFDYAIKFKSFSRHQRLNALQNIQLKSKLSVYDEKELLQVAKDYILDPGALSISFKKVGALQDGRVNKKKLVSTLLKSQDKLINGESFGEKPLENCYNPDFINSSLNESEIIHILKKYYEGKAPVHNICILFQGAPGTGKTEFVKYISEQLERELIVKRASDIFRPYLGMTERNIADMFEEAERNGDILFIDECDSLFKSRENAERAYMISQTNELLTQMERFRGSLICATNFMDNIDHAAMRRFHLKVQFNDLVVDKLPAIYKSFYGELTAPLTEHEVQELKSITGLNPGDFKAVFNGVVFSHRVTNTKIISRLRDEASYKRVHSKISLMKK